MTIRNKVVSLFISCLVLIVVGGFTIPSTAHVERSLHIDATPAEIFPLVGDLSAWQKWSPWAEMDPEMEMTVNGSGEGQVLSWQSNDSRVGSGTQKITTLAPPQYVKSHLDFGKQGVADVAFILQPENEGTVVSWTFDSDMREGVPFLQKPISTYLSFFMDGIIGKDYIVGLNNINALVKQSERP